MSLTKVRYSMAININSYLQQGHWDIMQHFKQRILKTCTPLLLVNSPKTVGSDHFGHFTSEEEPSVLTK